MKTTRVAAAGSLLGLALLLSSVRAAVVFSDHPNPSGAGWSNTRISSLDDAGDPLWDGDIHGPWHSNLDSVSYPLTGLPAHENLRIQLRYFATGTFDSGEQPLVRVDGQVVFQVSRGGPTSCGTGWVTFAGPWFESSSVFCYYDIDVSVAHSGSSATLVVGVTGLSEGVGGEGWSFNRLFVSTTSSTCDSEPAPPAGANLVSSCFGAAGSATCPFRCPMAQKASGAITCNLGSWTSTAACAALPTAGPHPTPTQVGARVEGTNAHMTLGTTNPAVLTLEGLTLDVSTNLWLNGVDVAAQVAAIIGSALPTTGIPGTAGGNLLLERDTASVQLGARELALAPGGELSIDGSLIVDGFDLRALILAEGGVSSPGAAHPAVVAEPSLSLAALNSSIVFGASDDVELAADKDNLGRLSLSAGLTIQGANVLTMLLEFLRLGL